jgi:hypothetical protein
MVEYVEGPSLEQTVQAQRPGWRMRLFTARSNPKILMWGGDKREADRFRHRQPLDSPRTEMALGPRTGTAGLTAMT